jgi:hypothetical protein
VNHLIDQQMSRDPVAKGVVLPTVEDPGSIDLDLNNSPANCGGTRAEARKYPVCGHFPGSGFSSQISGDGDPARAVELYL